ncbi:MAG: chorismate synthase [Coriobacteriaceae bacterium]|nr:chorismate synthase [Coriobacteriaceae bacterium]
MEFVTAGESHGPALTVIVSGVPAGLDVDVDAIDADLARRQSGYGRGGRQQIESDHVEVLSGLRFSRTLGSPITLQIVNADHKNWTDRMASTGAAPDGMERETHPRPGHADLVGMLKTDSDDARDVLERSSARETAARVAAGGIAKALLAALDVSVGSFVTRIGEASMDETLEFTPADVEESVCRCPDPQATEAMVQAIDAAKEAGESLGGEFCVKAEGLVPGLGSYASGPERLTSRLGAAVFSIPAIKGVEFGLGFEAAQRPGSEVHDGITYDENGYGRLSNNAGGLEGGMTTGQPLVIKAAMKPIPTLAAPLATVDTDTHEQVEASTERSDTCAVPAAAVVAEAEVACVLADAYLHKFGSDALCDILAAKEAYLARIGQV